MNLSLDRQLTVTDVAQYSNGENMFGSRAAFPYQDPLTVRLQPSLTQSCRATSTLVPKLGWLAQPTLLKETSSNIQISSRLLQ